MHEVYNEIALHFSQTRYKPWPIVEDFLTTRPEYSIGIDVGCGNGKYLGVNPKLFMIGTDRSDGLIKCASEISQLSFNLGVADGLSLPHADNTFDFAISIAVIHHFSTESRRIEAIQHIMSKLRKGGEALIYCWALEQERSRRGYKEGDDQDVLIPWVLQKKVKKPKQQKSKGKSRNNVAREGQAQVTQKEKVPIIEGQDASAEVKDAEQATASEPEPEPEVKYRYYHLYRRGELADNAARAGNCSVVREGYEKDNWWIVLRKE